MKKSSQIQKIISLLMIFILLIQLSGCYSTRIIPSSDLPLPDSKRYFYVIHSQDSKYRLDNTLIEEGILSGKIVKIYEDSQYGTGNKIHIYLSSDSVMKINHENILSLTVDGVDKVETVTDTGISILLVLAGIIILGIIQAVFSPSFGVSPF